MLVGLMGSWVMGMTILFLIVLEIALLYDQKALTSQWIVTLLGGIIGILDSCDTRMVSPLFGTNDSGQNHLQKVFDWTQGAMQIGYDTKAERVRDLDISAAPLPMSERPNVKVEEVLEYYNIFEQCTYCVL